MSTFEERREREIEWKRYVEVQAEITKMKNTALDAELPEWTRKLDTRTKRALLLGYRENILLNLSIPVLMTRSRAEWMRMPNLGGKSVDRLMRILTTPTWPPRIQP